MRIFPFVIGIALAFLSACFLGKDRTADSKEWDKVAFWKTATEEKVALCLEAGADPAGSQGYSGWAPLHLAAAHNNKAAVIALLVAAGADPNVRDNSGETPLHWAARKNVNPAIIVGLVAAGADPNAKDNSGETPLHKAARNNNPAVIKALLKAGADSRAKNKDDKTPWDHAEDNENIKSQYLDTRSSGNGR